MKNNLISKRYAKPLFQTAIKQNLLDKVYLNMKLLTSVCVKEPLIKKILQNPILDSEKKKNILNKIFQKNLNPITESFFNLLIKRRRESYICEIAESFLKIYNNYTNTKKAHLTTPFEIPEDILKIVEEKAKKIGKCNNIKIIKNIDSKLIGGYILRVEDKQIDASFKSILRNIKDNINNQTLYF